MAARLLQYVRAFFILSFCSAVFAQSDFPTIEDLEIEFYTTEVQITDVRSEITAYATEYYNNIDDQGVVKVAYQGSQQSIYYDNSTYQITAVIEGNCSVWDEDISEYDYQPLFYGWLNKDPLIIGPSAPLWYAQTRRNDIKNLGTHMVRDIPCDTFMLPVSNKLDDLAITYYFAPDGWTTPYQFEKLRVPIRIQITGKSSRYSAQPDIFTQVNQVNDFAFFKPSISDLNDLLPPIGLGCLFKEPTERMPEIPKVFQYSAEVVDVLAKESEADTEIRYQRTYYDHTGLLARRDKYSRKKGFTSTLFDFNTGTQYVLQMDGSCQMKILRDSEFQVYDYGMTSRMMTPAEALNLDGTFYEMGKREIRGIPCDTYESVVYDEYFMDTKYHKLVVTAYFTDEELLVETNGETESRVPVYYVITGWSTPKDKTLQLQYNIFQFDDVIWPEMYSSFGLERCYTKPDTKVYMILVMKVPAKDAAIMESQDEIVVMKLRSTIAKHAKVPEMRIPYLKVDYTASGVNAKAVMLERPPALLQFYKFDTGPTTTFDKFLKVIPDAENLEQCSYACVDEADYLCKGFYFCGQACFLKSTDPFDQEDDGKEQELGVCTEYLRGEIESSNFRQAYLADALENLEMAIFNQTVTVSFEIPNAEEIVKVSDIFIGDGPYTGTDAGDKPFIVSVESRKLDSTFTTTKTAEYAATLHECYKRCKAAGSECSSFSYCPDSPNDNKECLISSVLVIKGVTRDTDLKPDKNCNVYNLKYLEYFTEYKEKVSLLPGDKVIESVPALQKCAEICRLEKEFKCRGFEYCKNKKVCTLHTKHILDLKPGESGSSDGAQCIHYAARYIADYMDMGPTLIDDKTDVRYDTTLEECAKICSENLKEKCKSFNFCPSVDFSQPSCALSGKLLVDNGVTTTEKDKCVHYEKRDIVHDWDNSKAEKLVISGYTKKGFTGLVVGMLFLGLIVGAMAFIAYSYFRSRSSDDGMAVRFTNNS